MSKTGPYELKEQQSGGVQLKNRFIVPIDKQH